MFSQDLHWQVAGFLLLEWTVVESSFRRAPSCPSGDVGGVMLRRVSSVHWAAFSRGRSGLHLLLEAVCLWLPWEEALLLSAERWCCSRCSGTAQRVKSKDLEVSYLSYCWGPCQQWALGLSSEPLIAVMAGTVRHIAVCWGGRLASVCHFRVTVS